MNLFKLLLIALLALLAVVPLSCKGSGGGGGGSTKAGIRSDRVELGQNDSLSAEVIRGEWNSKKLWLEIVFQNNGGETVNFQLSQISVDLGGKTIPAKGFLGASMESDIDLLPSQVKTKKYGFHHLEFGVAGPTPGTYNLSVRGVRRGGAAAGDLVVPFTVN